VARHQLNDLSAPRAEAKSFDRWFYSLPKRQQDQMRDANVIPYREMVQARHVFEINPNHQAWATKPEEGRTEVDAFISRDHVGLMLKAFIDALAHTDNFRFRRHVELVRWSLALPGCLSAPVIARMYGITKQALHKRGAAVRNGLPVGDAARFKPAKR
jgi:hypothetical protein